VCIHKFSINYNKTSINFIKCVHACGNVKHAKSNNAVEDRQLHVDLLATSCKLATLRASDMCTRFVFKSQAGFISEVSHNENLKRKNAVKGKHLSFFFKAPTSTAPFFYLHRLRSLLR
jgi:hypothetical protein